MKRYALIPALALSACNPSLTSLDPDFHPVQRNWSLLWSDEFTGNTLDTSKWVLGQFCGGYNGEQQCYSALPQNVVVGQGVLTITALPASCSGSTIAQAEANNWVGTPATTCGSGSFKFSSAFLHTRVQPNSGLHAWRYGRIEIRAKLPYGTGTWPAFWMMPLDGAQYAYWPGAGEIDMMETANLRTPLQPVDWVQTNIHACSSVTQAWEVTSSSAAITGCQSYSQLTTNPNDANAVDPHDPNAYKKISSEKKLKPCAKDLVNKFHTYAIEWSDWDLRFYIDDELIQQLNHRPLNPQPFQEPFYLIINLAVGGAMTGFMGPVPNPPTNWLGSPSQPKASLILDWVRVYKCGADSTAKNCIYKGQGIGPSSVLAIPCGSDPTGRKRRPGAGDEGLAEPAVAAVARSR
jgi:beta-glucanase (GH16 family)